LRDEPVFCPFPRKGAVMRTMAAMGEIGSVVEGVRIPADDGWALVLPHATEAVVHVHAEGTTAASTEAILARYVAEVHKAIADG
jgi:phosphomannomutase